MVGSVILLSLPQLSVTPENGLPMILTTQFSVKGSRVKWLKSLDVRKMSLNILTSCWRDGM